MTLKYGLLLAAALALAPAAAQAERTHALVIGVNAYVHVPALDGARDDALDITQALKRGGVERVVTLLDNDVTKANLTAALEQLLTSAQKGDTLFISYAGHGAQARERKPGDEKDGKDEFWVLPGFDPKRVRETWRETVFDNELNQWFVQASAKGVRVIFVSDSCHAGGMERSLKTKLRFVEFGKDRLIGDLLSFMSSGDAADKGSAESLLPPNVTMLAATSEDLPVPEVVIDGKARGALSWSVARALEGNADRDGDGQITRAELEDYVFSTVRIRSESLQTPVFTPAVAKSRGETLLALESAGTVKVAADTTTVKRAGRPTPMMARDLGFEPVLPLVVKGAEIKVPDTKTGENAYEWDAEKGVFRTPNGDIAAENITEFTLGDVVAKFILLDFLKAVSASNPGRTDIAPIKQVYYAGDRIKFDTVRGNYKNMVVFNLANTGEVQFLDMVVDGEPTQKAFLKEMKVVPPFGADHLVTIASNEPLEAIGQAAGRGVNPKELLGVISERIDGKDASVSIFAIYTRAK